jgi:hypothetical protein
MPGMNPPYGRQTASQRACRLDSSQIIILRRRCHLRHENGECPEYRLASSGISQNHFLTNLLPGALTKYVFRLFSPMALQKQFRFGKPIEKWGRKASGLTTKVDGSGVASRNAARVLLCRMHCKGHADEFFRIQGSFP